MDYQSTVDSLKMVIEPVLERKGIELVELKFLSAPGGQILQLLVDRVNGGISLGECTQVNRELIVIMESQNLISDKYVLEVSSPGLGRPLKTKNDFLRCLNKEARFFLLEEVNQKIEFSGIIKNADEITVQVEVNGESWEVPLSKIRMAKQVI